MIFIKKNNNVLERIDINDNKKISGNGSNMIMIYPQSSFEPLKYDIVISNNVFRDYNGTTISFTTNNSKVVTLLSHIPEQNALNVSLTQSIILRFSEPVNIDSNGSIILYNSYNDNKEFIVDLKSNQIIKEQVKLQLKIIKIFIKSTLLFTYFK